MTHDHQRHPFSDEFIEYLVAQCKLCSQHVYEARICRKFGVDIFDENEFIVCGKIGVGVFQRVLALDDSLTCGENRGLGCQLFKDHLIHQHAKHF